MALLMRQIARDACKFLWRRPGLSMEQRSMATLSAVTALGREGQLWEHIEDGLTLGLSAERIVEVFIHLFFYVGSPAASSALVVAKQVFDARGIKVNPQRVHDLETTENPLDNFDEYYRSQGDHARKRYSHSADDNQILQAKGALRD